MKTTILTFRYKTDGKRETLVDGQPTEGYLTIPALTLSANLEREREVGRVLGMIQAREGDKAAEAAERMLELGLQHTLNPRPDTEGRGETEPLKWATAGKVEPPGRRAKRRRGGDPDLRWVNAGKVEPPK